MSENVEVSWHPKYSIDISNMDAMAVYHLSEALKSYIKSNTAVHDDISDCFNKTIEVCECIVAIDDRD